MYIWVSGAVGGGWGYHVWLDAVVRIEIGD